MTAIYDFAGHINRLENLLVGLYVSPRKSYKLHYQNAHLIRRLSYLTLHVDE